MIPVPNVMLAVQAWQRMFEANCHPLGVLVYAGGDYQAVARFMKAHGLETADGLLRGQAGNHYAIIATDIPTDSWRGYARQRNLLWWQWFGPSFASQQEVGTHVDVA